MLAIAPDYPSLRQIIVTFDTARLGVLFLILRRLCSPTPRWGDWRRWSCVEIVLGITGFFAGFREPMVLAGAGGARECSIAATTGIGWPSTVGGVGVTVMLGLLWMGIRGEYRREYVEVDKFRRRRDRRAWSGSAS